MNKRILVIDDEERIQEVIQTCLEILCGWEVLTAGSGKEGLLKAETQPPDAILLDVSLPEMDGFTIFQRLQENPVTHSIPVVLLTAKVQSADRAKFTQLGVAGVIIKPFDPVQLAAQVALAVGWNF
ncbi:MAG TPA: response regulator [Coleofasciculaceae cyanobacterium]|jgi:CheY-like chemotaxis protein